MKITLRELFLLVVIAAMGCGWWVDRASIAQRERSLSKWEQELDAADKWQEAQGEKLEYLLMLVWDKYPQDHEDWTAELKKNFPSPP